MTDVKSFLLRVEAVNLGNFISDSDDLSTIRGAGLLLLNAGRFLCGRSDVAEADAASGLFKTVDGKVWFKGRIQLDLVSAGASITLFSFRAAEPEAKMLRDDVEKWLRTGAGSQDAQQALRHATWAVELAPLEGQFTRANEQSVMRVRLAQMRSPNVSFGPLQPPGTPPVPMGFCDIDHKRPRSVNLKQQPKDPEKLEGSSYAKAPDKNFVSQATHRRRGYGRRTKVSVYQMVSQVDGPFEDFRPAWEFEEIGRRDSWLAEGDLDVAGRDRYGEAKDKMAVIYLDGNRFGKLLSSVAKTEQAYRRFDNELRELRTGLMRTLVEKIKAEPCWRVKPGGPEGRLPEKVRIETLLWGGDELIWVVPAWCGLEAVQFFFRHTAPWQLAGARLTHAVGLVICSHKSPIRSVVSLARELAENVKSHLADLGQEAISRAEISPGTNEFQHEVCANALAYEVLESFDHLGPDFQEARRGLRFPQMSETDAILTAAGLEQLVRHLAELKHAAPRIPLRRVHQIAQVFHRQPFSLDGPKGIQETAYGKLVQRIAETTGGGAAYQDRLNDPLHWKKPDRLPAKWFHLLELWKYAAYRPLDSAPDRTDAPQIEEARA